MYTSNAKVSKTPNPPPVGIFEGQHEIDSCIEKLETAQSLEKLVRQRQKNIQLEMEMYHNS